MAGVGRWLWSLTHLSLFRFYIEPSEDMRREGLMDTGGAVVRRGGFQVEINDESQPPEEDVAQTLVLNPSVRSCFTIVVIVFNSHTSGQTVILQCRSSKWKRKLLSVMGIIIELTHSILIFSINGSW